MSFLRAATTARRAATQARRYATAPPPGAKQPNWGIYLAGAGVVGLAGYLYLDSKDSAKGAVAAAVAKATNTESPLNPKEFKEFKIKRVEPYNWNTSKFVFELPENEASLLPVASLVYIKAPDDFKDKNDKPVGRPYTPTSSSDKPGELEFLIKKYENGVLSKYMHDNLKPGAVMHIKGPIPKIPWTVNEFEHVGMVAGGSGITPMYQILQHALADPTNKTKFTLLFGNVEERDILLRENFETLAKKHPETFKVVHVLGTAPENWKGPSGFITAELMKKEFASPLENVKVLVCGPPPQLEAIAGKKDGMKQGALGGALKELGYKEEQVYKF